MAVRAAPTRWAVLYAAREYGKNEVLTYYGGEDLGPSYVRVGDSRKKQVGEGMHEWERRKRGGGGKHTMIVDGRVIDGIHSNTGAQYANTKHGELMKASASYNARICGTGGTLRTKTRVRAGEEILFSYHVGRSFWESELQNSTGGGGGRREGV